ncbi:MAG TPA: glutaminyl-peptide cyclotransferase, partial [Aggregatilineales bacterium]|nr:glutaminyl-peptide cyclotransferase [Aggregatilineales bacterium]
ITWKNEVAIVYDLETFEPLEVFPYQGEGWGLCYDDEFLYMTDGSEFIYIRDPETFEVVDFRRVTLEGEPASSLNELECVDDEIYANVYQTDEILRIDKATGEVTAAINAFDLLTQEERDTIMGNDSGAVLNGIAYDAENDVFLITGKLWDKLFEVRFVPAES